MQKHSLSNMTGGWFIGDFAPTLLQTNDFEVAVKRYVAGQSEKKHHHKIATEYTVILSGQAMMNDQVFSDNDIVKVLPGESVEFRAITDLITVVVKTPSVKNDKFIDE